LPNLQQLRFNVRSIVPTLGLGLPQSSAVSTDGNFQIRGLREDEYQIQIAGLAPGHYVKSATYDGKDILGKSLHIRGTVGGTFEFVIKAGAPTIVGTVVDSNSKPAPGNTVVFVPAQRDSIELFRNADTDSSGKFSLTNVVPGEYKVFSWEAIDTNAYLDPDFLKQYEQLGKTVVVTENFSSSVDLKLIPAP
jgi:hypothetical protein